MFVFLWLEYDATLYRDIYNSYVDKFAVSLQNIDQTFKFKWLFDSWLTENK